MIITNITKVGNSTYVLIPEFIASQLKITKFDEIPIEVKEDGTVIITLRQKRE